MAKAGHAYPQAEPGVAALLDTRVLRCAPGAPVTRVLARARAAGATVVVLGHGRAARVSDLARAAAWGLQRRPVRDVAWRGLPTVAGGGSEIEARRHLLAGAPLVLGRRGARVIGAADRDRVGLAPPDLSILSLLEHPAASKPAPSHDARVWLLRVAGKIGEGMGAPCYAVGGFVRDLLAGAHAPDVDLVVEGDGMVRGSRCPPVSLRADVPDRDTGRPEHRPHRVVGFVCAGQ
jgi:hypothetical protein